MHLVEWVRRTNIPNRWLPAFAALVATVTSPAVAHAQVPDEFLGK